MIVASIMTLPSYCWGNLYGPNVSARFRERMEMVSPLFPFGPQPDLNEPADGLRARVVAIRGRPGDRRTRQHRGTGGEIENGRPCNRRRRSRPRRGATRRLVRAAADQCP